MSQIKVKIMRDSGEPYLVYICHPAGELALDWETAVDVRDKLIEAIATAKHEGNKPPPLRGPLPITAKEAFDHDIHVYCSTLNGSCANFFKPPDGPCCSLAHTCTIEYSENERAYISRNCPRKEEAQERTEQMMAQAFDEACAKQPPILNEEEEK